MKLDILNYSIINLKRSGHSLETYFCHSFKISAILFFRVIFAYEYINLPMNLFLFNRIYALNKHAIYTSSAKYCK